MKYIAKLIIIVGLLPFNTIAFEFGIGTHFGQGKGNSVQLFEWAASSEATSFRDEIYWGQVESSPGILAMNGNALKTYAFVQAASKKGLKPLVILGYGNKYYDNGTQPFTDAGRAAYANYVSWTVSQLKGYVPYYEVWNEWNIGSGTKPKSRSGDPADYVLLAQTAYKAIKQTDKNAQVIVGALGDDLNGFPWFKQALKQGVLKYADGVSVHLYNHCDGVKKAGAAEAVQRLNELQSIIHAANNGKALPIYVTEVGWPTNTGKCGIPENVAAEQSLRFLLDSISTVKDLAGIWWYEFLDGGYDPGERENRFGLLRTNYLEKPAGCRIRSIQPFLKNASVEKVITKADVKMVVFRNASGKRLLGVWRGYGVSDEPKKISMTGSFTGIDRFDVDCEDRSAPNVSSYTKNQFALEVNTYPKVFWLDTQTTINDFEILN